MPPGSARRRPPEVVPDLSSRSLAVAPALLGCVLRVRGVGVRLTEVEAYEGADDPASHAWRGPTARNAVMFGPAGRLYVYTMHGHACVNIVCGPDGIASAVLLRAGELVEGIEVARERRPGVRDAWLARGPGNLTRALGITRDDNGAVLDAASGVTLTSPIGERGEVRAGVRVNVSRAFDRPWRFTLDHPSVSALTLHPAARATH
ncbi:MAG: DNA-3-methyladenine glycosylase [Propioniciclava sp.]|uniref:DNA-3-methyladenine glycosylase n=1 Tax=Propioniciclava sp. TaxID=2038686 RepID=UPI0039E316AC